jgi:hypothetical protein
MNIKIDNVARLAELSDKEYKKLFGITKTTFDTMFEVLEKANFHERLKGGKKPTLSVLDRLVITLGYWREYRAYENIAFDYGVKKSVIGKHIAWVEDTLIECGIFKLPSKRELRHNQRNHTVTAIDVTEQEIERPKRGRKNGIPARKNGTQSKL